MHKIVRGLVAGSLIGAAVGLIMLINRKREVLNTGQINRRAGGAVKMVRDNTMRWTSALKDGTEAFSRRLARRTS